MPVSHHYLRRLPAQEQVFVSADAKTYRDAMFPLASVNLRRVNPLWSGWVSWVYSFEDPYFDGAAAFDNDLCQRDHKLTFERVQGKQKFAADPGFFTTSESWKKHVEAAAVSWRAAREKYCKAPVTLGGKPKWIQSDATPTDPDGKKMTFIGHVYSHDFLDCIGAKDLFLFYSHKHQRVTQITQVT